jgi:hypothetical protein
MKKSTKVDMGTSRKFYKLLLDPGARGERTIDQHEGGRGGQGASLDITLGISHVYP